MGFSIWIMLGICCWLVGPAGCSTINYNDHNLNPLAVIQEAVSEAYQLSTGAVRKEYAVYLDEATIKPKNQKLVGDSIVFDFAFSNSRTATSYDARVSFDLILWEPCIVYFVWSTSIDDLLQFDANH